MSIDKQLKLAKSFWKKAKERAESGQIGSVFEDGRYKSSITRAELQESKASGRLQIAWAFEFLEGEYIGQTIYSYDGADTEDHMVRCLMILTKLGQEIDDPEDIEAALEKILKKRSVVQITVKTRGEFQNVSIDKVLTGDEAVGELPDEGSTEEVTPEEPEGEEVQLQEGSKVSFKLKGEEVEGEVVEILEDENAARVKYEDRIYKIKAEMLTLVEEVPTEPEEEPEPEPEEEERPKKKIIKKIGKVLKKKR